MGEVASYSVPDMHCDHCKAAVAREVEAVVGVERVDVDLDSKIVTVTGTQLDNGALHAAIDEAGYEATEIPA